MGVDVNCGSFCVGISVWGMCVGRYGVCVGVIEGCGDGVCVRVRGGWGSCVWGSVCRGGGLCGGFVCMGTRFRKILHEF